MHIEINRVSKTPLYLQVKNQIKNMIISGALPADFNLPSERTLSADLKLNRSTIVKAYSDLKAEGFVESYVGKGTVILAQLSKDKSAEKTYIPPLRWNQLESRLFKRNNEQTITNMLSIFEKDKIISFASGIPSEDSYPMEKFGELQVDMLKKYKEKLFMPVGVEGSSELKTAIKGLLNAKDIIVTLKQLIITTGSQQGIDFWGKLFIEPGDIVIVEEPTFTGAIQTFEAYGARIIGIPIDETGMDLNILETCLLKYRPKFIYCQPTFHNPTGITMSLQKRKELLKLAYYYQIPILEDDPYSEIRFEGEHLPTLKALDTHDYVVYLSSFSKTLSFSLRVGFIAGNESVLNRITGFKQLSDIQTNTQAQYFVSEFINSGYYKTHLDFIKNKYKKKCDLMVALLSQSKIQGLKLQVPQGGYFLWCKLPDTLRLSELIENASSYGILIMPGDVFYPNGVIGESYIRLNFSYPSEKDITEGVKRLIKAIKKCSNISRSSKASLYTTINPFL
ncbi:MAG: PLP-dependent aminotransferase family protein [Clostridiaceae bacterium]|nr:PLP-dependent aminotransferase family protein [Clostridiaceae bacterium]